MLSLRLWPRAGVPAAVGVEEAWQRPRRTGGRLFGRVVVVAARAVPAHQPHDLLLESLGALGVAGIGFKLFMGRALALRLDARDHVYRQELLDEQFLVNDVSVTLGLSVFLPFRN